MTVMKTIYRQCIVLLLISEGLSLAASRHPIQGKNGMVVSAEPNASQVGIEILQQGGNAIDAAVAVGFALAVTYPQAGNIGGGGFMVVRFANGRTTTIDYREKAPAKAWRDMFLDEKGNYLPAKSQEGYLSCGVPGSVAGLLFALERYGTLGRKKVLQPVIKLAEKGFMISKPFAHDLDNALARFGYHKSLCRIFSKNGKSLKTGDLLLQLDLAGTLERIAQNGSDGFYKGKTADLIVAEMQRGGGLISLDDLHSYRAMERPPVVGTYRGYDIISMGPPSSGGILLIQLLNLLEPFNLSASGCASKRTIVLMAEAMKLAYADRAEFLGDSDFFPVPVAQLVSKSYAAERCRLIDSSAIKPSSAILHGSIQLKEHNETTHYSVIDQWGNAVSVTTTINDLFGNGIVVDGAGFFLNNEMDDFASKPGQPNMFGVTGGEANAIQPQKRMLSSMAPTIVSKDGKPYLIIGSPGGSTIITTVLQIILNVIDHKMGIQEAVDAPRIHHQWLPDTLWYEKGGLENNVVEQLNHLGFNIIEQQGHQGNVEAILVDSKNRTYWGVADRRGYGVAIGY